MPSAVDQLINNYETSSPVDWSDFYNAYGSDQNQGDWVRVNPGSFGAKFNDWILGTESAAKVAYENYLNEYKNHRDTQAQKAEWAREDSAVQRAVADIKKAGLNPWLALNGGSMSSAVNASSSAPVRYQARDKLLQNDKGKNEAVNLLSSAIKVLFMAAMFM